MITLTDFLAPVRLLSGSTDVNMPFSDTVKYCILGVSVMLLLLALGILAWQAFRCWTQTHTTFTLQDTGNTNQLCSDEMSTGTGQYSAAPSTKILQYAARYDIEHDVVIKFRSVHQSEVTGEAPKLQHSVAEINAEADRLSRCLSQDPLSSSESSQVEGDLEEQANIKRVDGSLRFSVYYDQLQSCLVVTILQVGGLLDHSQTLSLQPFVKIRLMWAESEGVELEGCKDEEGEEMPPVLWTVMRQWQTRIVKGSCNPVFGDQFSCVLPRDKDTLHRIVLRMEVRDFDKFSRHTALGEVRVPLRQLNMSYPLELQEDLQIPQKDLVGKVLLSLKFLPTSQRLEIGLLKVKTIFTEICPDAALYARISVQYNQSRLRYQKTSAVSRCLVTVFNEVLMFSLPEFPLEQCKIMVSIYETRRTRKATKQLMGQLTVGKEKAAEDEHWNLMMRSIRQPVAKWHSLMI